MQNNMNKYQRFAIDHYIEHYCPHLSFQEVLQIIIGEKDIDTQRKKAMPYEVYELEDVEDIVSWIVSMSVKLEQTFKSE